MENQTKSWDFNLLKSHICEVTFTKVDGDVRVMPCTLREDLLPTINSDNSDGKVKRANDTVLSVWCTDKNEWRSFRISNVTNLRVLA